MRVRHLRPAKSIAATVLAASTRAADQFRSAMVADAQRRARQAAINQTIDEILQMNNPLPPPLEPTTEVVYVSEEEWGPGN